MKLGNGWLERSTSASYPQRLVQKMWSFNFVFVFFLKLPLYYIEYEVAEILVIHNLLIKRPPITAICLNSLENLFDHLLLQRVWSCLNFSGWSCSFITYIWNNFGFSYHRIEVSERYHPVLDEEGLLELRKIAQRLEEKAYATATTVVCPWRGVSLLCNLLLLSMQRYHATN